MGIGWDNTTFAQQGGEGKIAMKWKQFLLIWLILFLLAPSIWFHTLFMEGMPPPGSHIEGPSMIMPFGAVQMGIDCFEQLIGGDFMDALMIFLWMILPIAIYTFVLSWIVYYAFRKIRERWPSTQPHS
jgi:antibiotic biosynthesis monooxygenase (ABM) superfamily enzyme